MGPVQQTEWMKDSRVFPSSELKGQVEVIIKTFISMKLVCQKKVAGQA